MNVSIKTAKLFLQGDEEATATVYHSYRSLLYFIIATYLKEKEDCDDIYQEVFVKVLARRSEIKDPSSLHYYLCAMAKNEAIDFAKKKAHFESSDELDGDGDSASNGQLDYFLPYDLSKQEKMILGYRLTFGFSWKEIGEILEMPIPTAKLRYAQAIKKIKGAYGK